MRKVCVPKILKTQLETFLYDFANVFFVLQVKASQLFVLFVFLVFLVIGFTSTFVLLFVLIGIGFTITYVMSFDFWSFDSTVLCFFLYLSTSYNVKLKRNEDVKENMMEIMR